MKIVLILGAALLSMTSLLAGEGDIVRVGDKAPLFAGVDSEGKSVSLASFRGSVVVLDFFATWCPSCLEEMPHLQSEVWAKNKAKGLIVLAVGREHSMAEMAKFKSQKKLGFTLVADPKREIYAKYAKEYIPRTYLIDRDGVIRAAGSDYTAKDFAKFKIAVARQLDSDRK